MAIQGQTLPDRAEDLDGLTKTAILLLNLDRQAAAKLLQRLPSDKVDEVTRVVASLDEVPPQLSAAVIEEFYRLRLSQQHAGGGGLERMEKCERGSPDGLGTAQRPFSFLHKVEVENVLTFIQDEHPQTIAMILSYLPHHRASDILGRLPGSRQVEVVRRIASMERANPDVIREVEQALETRLSSMLGPAMDKVGGVETVAEVLNLCDRNTEHSIMHGIGADDPDLMEKIRRLMFVFEDLLMVNDKGIQAMLKEVDHDELALALKTASEAVKEKIFSNMSTRASDLIREEMEYMGPVRVSEVEAAQQRLVDIVRRLEDSGEVIIGGRTGESEIVV